MNDILRSAVELQKFCEERSWRFCYIGGLAVQRWGEPRMTRDADMTILTGFGNEQAYIDPLLAAFIARRPDAKDFAIRYRVLLLKDHLGTPLDIALGALPFEETSIERSSNWTIGTEVLRTCSAEDLLVHKVFAGRDQDWLDVRGILVRQGPRLDLNQVEQDLLPLLELKGTTNTLERFQSLAKKLV